MQLKCVGAIVCVWVCNVVQSNTDLCSQTTCSGNIKYNMRKRAMRESMVSVIFVILCYVYSSRPESIFRI